MNQLIEAALENAEGVLDSFTESEILKNIPIVGTAIKLIKASSDIRDRIFAAKISRFLISINSVSDEAKTRIKTKVANNPDEARKIGETILLIIEHISDLDKAEMIAKIFLSYIYGYLTPNEFRRISEAIDQAFIDDLRRLVEAPAEFLKQSEEPFMQYLSRTGLTRPVGNSNSTWQDIGKIYYEPSTLGNKFINAYHHSKNTIVNKLLVRTMLCCAAQFRVRHNHNMKIRRELVMRLVFGILILFLLQPTCLFAFQNEPKEFRGIKWGGIAETQKDLILHRKEGDVSIYTRKNDKMQIGDVWGIKSIYYIYYKNKFFKVIINMREEDGLKYFDRLADVFESLYGRPSKENIKKGDPFFSKKPVDMTKSWRGSVVNVDLFGLLGFPLIFADYTDGCDYNYSEVMSTVFCASYQYKPVALEYDRYKKEQKRLKDAQEKSKLEQERRKIQKEKAEKAKRDL